MLIGLIALEILEHGIIFFRFWRILVGFGQEALDKKISEGIAETIEGSYVRHNKLLQD